jgi:hypothetical protein
MSENKAKAEEGKVVAAQVNEDVLNFTETVGTEVERRLKFKPRAKLNNLCQGYLISVELKMVEAPTVDSKSGLPSTWEYAGCTLPNLHLLFLQEPTADDPMPRYSEKVIKPYTNADKQGAMQKRTSIIQHYRFEYEVLRHIANAFKTHTNYDATVVIPPVNPFLDPIERVADLTKYYTAWFTLLNGKGGKGFANQLNWIKVVADSLTGAYLAIPDFVGEGFIEKVVDGRNATIELKPNETVILTPRKGKTAVAASGAAGGGEEKLTPEMQAIVDKYNNGGQ